VENLREEVVAGRRDGFAEFLLKPELAGIHLALKTPLEDAGVEVRGVREIEAFNPEILRSRPLLEGLIRGRLLNVDFLQPIQCEFATERDAGGFRRAGTEQEAEPFVALRELVGRL